MFKTAWVFKRYKTQKLKYSPPPPPLELMIHRWNTLKNTALERSEPWTLEENTVSKRFFQDFLQKNACKRCFFEARRLNADFFRKNMLRRRFFEILSDSVAREKFYRMGYKRIGHQDILEENE